ncbi:MAG: hypothetical protein K2M89_04245 [Clostridiales bacterium]|nr:hypothetical protein [Clostridiales bacterium]
MKVTSDDFEKITHNLKIVFVKHSAITLIPNQDGSFYYLPQKNYNNKNHYPYINDIDETTLFCKFKPNLPKTKGVYLWVDDEDEIIYIGEGENLYSRFNNGYGNISPRNCYKGGQSTNVKMNRVALSYFNNNRTIDIYVCETNEHKRIEHELLSVINTQYNIQNNK